MDLVKFVERAKKSSFNLWLLNVAFNRMVPFNGPHGFRISEIGDHHVKTYLPYRRRNLNHVGGLHACALATLTEITCGFFFAVKLNPKKYRLILRKLEIDYLYQGKTHATAEFSLTDEWLNSNVFVPLASADAVDVVAEVVIRDVKGNQLTAGKAYWQIKDWAKVRLNPDKK